MDRPEQLCGPVLIRNCARLLVIDGLILASFIILWIWVGKAPEQSEPRWFDLSWSMWMSLWGLGITFNCLWLDAWRGFDISFDRRWYARNRRADAHNQRLPLSFRRKLKYVVCSGHLAPFANLFLMILAHSAYSVLSRIINDMPDDPRGIKPSEKIIKIIASCKVVVGTREGSIPATHGRLHARMENRDEEDALVLGHNHHLNSYMVQLNYKGKEALLRSGVLIPRSESLRLLRRKDRSMVMALAGVQAFGYILSVIIRSTIGCNMYPFEFAGFQGSVLVVVYAVHDFVAMSCHRPLLVYLRPGYEQDMVSQLCNITRWSNDESSAMAMRVYQRWGYFVFLLMTVTTVMQVAAISKYIRPL